MKRNIYNSVPDKSGYFGKYGGRFVAETLVPLILEVEKAYKNIKKKKKFINEFKKYLKDYVGRPSPLYFAENISKKLNGPKIYFKRDELNHTGAHKINNCEKIIFNDFLELKLEKLRIHVKMFIKRQTKL